MNYATGEQPQVGDRVTFLRVNGQPKEGVVTKVGMTGLFVQIAVPSTRRWARDGKTFVSGIVPLVDLLARAPIGLVQSAPDQSDQIVQEVVLNLVGPDGSRKEVVMNMGPGVNTVILSGKVDPSSDLDEGDLIRLELFDHLEVVVPNGYLDRDIDHGDEVLVTGHLEQIDHEGGKIVVVADQVVKLG